MTRPIAAQRLRPWPTCGEITRHHSLANSLENSCVTPSVIDSNSPCRPFSLPRHMAPAERCKPGMPGIGMGKLSTWQNSANKRSTTLVTNTVTNTDPCHGTGLMRRVEGERDQREHRKSAGTGRMRRAEGEREHRNSAGTGRVRWRRASASTGIRRARDECGEPRASASKGSLRARYGCGGGGPRARIRRRRARDEHRKSAGTGRMRRAAGERD